MRQNMNYLSFWVEVISSFFVFAFSGSIHFLKNGIILFLHKSHCVCVPCIHYPPSADGHLVQFLHVHFKIGKDLMGTLLCFPLHPPPLQPPHSTHSTPQPRTLHPSPCTLQPGPSLCPCEASGPIPGNSFGTSWSIYLLSSFPPDLCCL